MYADPEAVFAKIAEREESLRCGFWDGEGVAWSGCSFVSVSEWWVRCYCKHLTDFMAFLDKGREMAHNSNYSAFSALSELTLSSLLTNTAVHIFFSFLLCYLILGSTAVLYDRSRLKDCFYRRLF